MLNFKIKKNDFKLKKFQQRIYQKKVKKKRLIDSMIHIKGAKTKKIRHLKLRFSATDCHQKN